MDSISSEHRSFSRINGLAIKSLAFSTFQVSFAETKERGGNASLRKTNGKGISLKKGYHAIPPAETDSRRGRSVKVGPSSLR
jgi:hypothetical protein